MLLLFTKSILYIYNGLLRGTLTLCLKVKPKCLRSGKHSDPVHLWMATREKKLTHPLPGLAIPGDTCKTYGLPHLLPLKKEFTGPGLHFWRRKWQPTPVFLPGESQGAVEPGGLLSMGSHRVRHDWSDLAAAAGLHLRPVHADHALPPFQWTLNSVFSAYENNNRRIRPPPDRGTLKIVSRLLIA